MKLTILALLAAIPTATMACETRPIVNTNAVQRVDPNCPIAVYREGGFSVGPRTAKARPVEKPWTPGGYYSQKDLPKWRAYNAMRAPDRGAHN